MHTGERESDQGDSTGDGLGAIERGRLMDERGYVAEALLDRLRDEGVPFRALGPEAPASELALAVARETLPGMPRRMARFAQDFDLRLVQLSRDERQRIPFPLAWSDEVGRPRLLEVHAVADFFRPGRALLGSEELLSGRPEVLLLYSLVEAIQTHGIDEGRAAWLSRLWHADPRGALERIGGLWPARPRQGPPPPPAEQGSWGQVGAPPPPPPPLPPPPPPHPFC